MPPSNWRPPTISCAASSIATTASEPWRPKLDGQYTAFGRVLSGQDIVDRISAAPRDANDRPLADVVVESVTVEPG